MQGAVLRLRDTVMRSLHEFFHQNDFVYVHTPIITSNDAEGAGESFRLAPVLPRSADRGTQNIEFFNKPSYLTVSSQLHLEVLSNAVARVWTLSPCFRAERSQTSRHLAEFWMLEAEWSFVRSVNDLCDVAEASIKHVLRPRSPDRDLLQADIGASWTSAAIAAASEVPWARITYTDAIHELQKSGAHFEFTPRWGSALQSEHERWLADSFARGPIFVTDYPAAIKPFYMRQNDDGKTVACFDLLVPHVGELVGGSLREERLTLLESAIRRQGLDEEAYRWYTELRKFGGAPHGGYGMGFERLISWLGGIENVRECIPMPRWSGRMLL